MGQCLTSTSSKMHACYRPSGFSSSTKPLTLMTVKELSRFSVKYAHVIEFSSSTKPLTIMTLKALSRFRRFKNE